MDSLYLNITKGKILAVVTKIEYSLMLKAAAAKVYDLLYTQLSNLSYAELTL